LDPTLNTVGTKIYYAEAFNPITECVSLTRTAVKLSIIAAPEEPLSGGDQVICETSILPTLTATATASGTVTWYTESIGGEIVSDPILNSVGSVIYYAQNSEGNCQSLARTPVKLTILQAPLAPVSGGDQFFCAADPVQKLTANAFVPAGFRLLWYDAPLGGNLISDPSLSTIGSVVYYAASVDNETDCVSLTRTPVKLTLYDCLISLEKEADKTSVNNSGEPIQYKLTIANKGNVGLSDVKITDPLTGLSQDIGFLEAGESQEVMTSYTVDQQDMDFGSISNLAIVTAKGPDQKNVQAQDEVIVLASQDPKIDIEVLDTGSEITKAGQTIDYTLTVINIGNVTLSNVTVFDPLTSLEVNIGTLIPGQKFSLPTKYLVSQQDVDRGSVLNEVKVSGESPNETDQDPSDLDEELTIIKEAPALILEKLADKSVISNVGEVVIYSLKVINTGNVTLNSLSVVDPLTSFEENLAVLIPGESVSFETSYVVRVEDLSRGFLTNVANSTALSPSKTKIQDQDSLEIGVSVRPILANSDDFGSFFLNEGGLIGNILENDLLNGVRVLPEDVDFEFTELDGIIGLSINENGNLTLAPDLNETRAYSLSYTLREIANPTNLDEAKVVFQLLNDPINLKVEKTSNEIEIFEGDEFTYQIRVTNQEPSPAYNVIIADDLPQNVTYLSNKLVSVSNPQIVVNSAVTGSRITWSIPIMPGSANLLIEVTVKAGLAGAVINTVNVRADEPELDPLDNQDSDVNEINPLHIPNVITPNGDNDNDSFLIQGLAQFTSNEIIIFNRYGDHVWEAEDYQNDWKATGQVAGTYFYVLKAVDSVGKTHEFKGWVQVIKD
jgi:gliding motility-associated-like protein/uncharacterized repeat protein (TIGR01451 family)